MKDQNQFEKVAPVKMLVMSTLKVEGLERVIHWVFQKEQRLGEEKDTIVKGCLVYLEQQT